jgi:HEPN domain-containing protein
LSSIDYVELLRRRSKTYYEYSQEAFERGDYDIAIFMVGQAAQLRVKSVILRILGYTPRTHRVRELLAVLAEALSSLNKSSLASRIKALLKRIERL